MDIIASAADISAPPLCFEGSSERSEKKYGERSLYSHISRNSFEFESLNHVFRRYSYCNAPARIVLNQKQRLVYRRQSQNPKFHSHRYLHFHQQQYCLEGRETGPADIQYELKGTGNQKKLMLTTQRPRALPIPKCRPKAVLESRRS